MAVCFRETRAQSLPTKQTKYLFSRKLEGIYPYRPLANSPL